MKTPIANAEDFIPDGEYNPYNVRPWVINNEYSNLCVVYAAHEQDAFDIAADNDCLGGLALDEEYAQELRDEYGDDADIMYLGNASEPFDSANAGIHPLKNAAPDDIRFTHYDGSTPWYTDIHGNEYDANNQLMK